MSEDRRELILSRLGVVLTGLLDAEDSFFRNKVEVPENRRPAIVLNDQDEARDEDLNSTGRGRPSNGPVFMDATPEIFLVIADKDAGKELNLWRTKVIKAVMTDNELTALCHEIRYEGFTSALAMGRTMEGQARLHFTFVYVLRIDQL